MRPPAKEKGLVGVAEERKAPGVVVKQALAVLGAAGYRRLRHACQKTVVDEGICCSHPEPEKVILVGLDAKPQPVSVVVE